MHVHTTEWLVGPGFSNRVRAWAGFEHKIGKFSGLINIFGLCFRLLDAIKRNKNNFFTRMTTLFQHHAIVIR